MTSKKYCFTNRIVNVWNSLPNWVVSADTNNNFKTRLNIGKTRILFMISQHSCMELEVVVNC